MLNDGLSRDQVKLSEGMENDDADPKVLSSVVGYGHAQAKIKKW
jgi:hypothetical protein